LKPKKAYVVLKSQSRNGLANSVVATLLGTRNKRNKRAYNAKNWGENLTGMYGVIMMMLIERAVRCRLHRHCAPPVTAEQVAASSCDPGTANPRFVNENRHRRGIEHIFHFSFADSEIRSVTVDEKWPLMRTLPVVDICNGFFFFI